MTVKILIRNNDYVYVNRQLFANMFIISTFSFSFCISKEYIIYNLLIYSLYTQSNAIQYNSSAIKSPFMMPIMFSPLLYCHKGVN